MKLLMRDVIRKSTKAILIVIATMVWAGVVFLAILISLSARCA